MVPDYLFGNCLILIDLRFFVMVEFVGVDRLKSRNIAGSKREAPAPKDGASLHPDVNIAAQIFTFRELATATKNFRPESFLGGRGIWTCVQGSTGCHWSGKFLFYLKI